MYNDIFFIEAVTLIIKEPNNLKVIQLFKRFKDKMLIIKAL